MQQHTPSEAGGKAAKQKNRQYHPVIPKSAAPYIGSTILTLPSHLPSIMVYLLHQLTTPQPMRALTLCYLVLMTLSCNTKKVATLAEANMPYLTFTSGGGFAGKYTTYVLLENGQIFEKAQFSSGDAPDSKSVGSLSDEEAAQIFSNYKVLDLDNVDQVSYGNYTYSIMKQDGDKQHKMVWEKDQAGSEILQVYYKNVMNAIQKSMPNVKAKKAVKQQ